MRTKEIILQTMLDSLSDDYQKTEGFPIHDILSAVAGGLETQSSDVEFAANQNNVNQLSGEHLEQFIYERSGIKRRAGTSSWGYLQITTNQYVIIPEGSLFATDNGTLFKNLTAARILDGKNGNGTADLYVESVEIGVDKNVPANSITKMGATIAGIIKVNNAAAFQGGSDGETDDELRERYLLKISNPSSSGNKLDYKEWALEVDGVGDAKVFPLAKGNNTVEVCIVGTNNSLPSTALVQKVQNYIDPGITGSGEGVAPIGAYCTVTAAVNYPIKIYCDLEYEPEFNPSDVRVSVRSALAEYIESIAFSTKVLIYNKIASIVMGVDGVKDFNDILLNSGRTNLNIADRALLTVGRIDCD